MEDRRVKALRAGSVYAGRTPTQWDGFLVSISDLTNVGILHRDASAWGISSW